MTAYVRRQTTKYGYHRFHVYEGLPDNHSEDTKTVGIYVTRRQAIRKAEQDGYKVIIKGNTPKIDEPLSISDTLMQVAEPNADCFTWETSEIDRNKVAQLAFADYGGAVSEPTVVYNNSTAQRSTKSDFSKVQTWGKSKSETEAEELKIALSELDSGIKQVFENGGYEDYLKTLSTFNNYSYANCVLISMQKPDATFVAGRKLWHDDFQRSVTDSENEIKIIAPSAYTEIRNVEQVGKGGVPIYDDDGKPVTAKVEVTVPVFKVVSVYDISQTHGKRMPSLGKKEYSDVEKQNIEPLIGKYAQTYLKKSELLQDSKKDSTTTKFEAESITYTLRHHFGLDSSVHTALNSTEWSHGKTIKQIKSSLGAIQKECKSIISEINKQRESLQKIQKENVPKTTQKSKSKTAKAPAQKKPSIRSDLEAAKKQAAAQKSTPTRAKSKAMELG